MNFHSWLVTNAAISLDAQYDVKCPFDTMRVDAQRRQVKRGGAGFSDKSENEAML